MLTIFFFEENFFVSLGVNWFKAASPTAQHNKIWNTLMCYGCCAAIITCDNELVWDELPNNI